MVRLKIKLKEAKVRLLSLDLSEKDLPADYLEIGEYYVQGRDVDGKMILWYRTDLHFKGKHSPEVNVKGFIYWVERIFRVNGFDKAVYVMDFSNFSMSNMDLDNVRSVVTIFRDYYPNTLNHIILYEMPFILTGKQHQSFQSFFARAFTFHSNPSSDITNHQKAPSQASR